MKDVTEYDPSNQFAERLKKPELDTAAYERRVVMVDDFLRYAHQLNDENNLGLLPHQIPAFEDTRDLFERYLERLLEDPKTPDLLTLAGYLDLPTSFGKTVMMAKIAEGLGIGVPQEGKPTRRALVLTHTTTSVDQIVGDAEKGFGRDLPHAKTTAYRNGRGLDGDVVVMTYTGFLYFIDGIIEGRIADPGFDLIMCDEAHHTLGEQTRQKIDAYRQGKIAFGLTATPEFDDKKTIKNIFETCIHKSEMRPLIEAGVFNGVQVIGLASDSQVRVAGTTDKDFSEKELRGLRLDENRNDAILEAAIQLIAEGRRGVVNAIAGNNCEHALTLAETLNGTKVERSDGKGTITIRAEAVGNFLSSKQQCEILQAYNRGEIHVLFQTDSLIESWDENEVNFIINAAPTASRVRAIQRFGRGLRPSKQWPITVVIEFFDTIIGNKMPFTAWHVLEEDEYAQGFVLTTPERKARIEKRAPKKQNVGKMAMRATGLKKPKNRASGPPPGPADEILFTDRDDNLFDDLEDVTTVSSASPSPAERSDDEPVENLVFDYETKFTGVLAEMRESYDLYATRILTIERQPELEQPKPGWVRLVDLLRNIRRRHDIGLYALRTAIVTEGGFGCELARGPDGLNYYAEPDAIEFVETYTPLEFAPRGWYGVPDFGRELKVSRQVVVGAIGRLEEANQISGETVEYRSRIARRRVEHYNPSDSELIKTEIRRVIDTIPAEDAPVRLLADLADAVGQARNTVQFFLIRHHGITGEPVTSPNTKRSTTAYSLEEAAIVTFHYGHVKLPEGAVVLEDLERESGIPEVEIRKASTTPEFQDLLQKGRYVDAGGRYHYTLFCAATERKNVVQRLRQLHVTEVIIERQPEVPPGPVIARQVSEDGELFDLRSLLQEVRCSPNVVRYLLRQIALPDQGIIQSRELNNGQRVIMRQAAEMLRRQCRELEAPPITNRSDYYFMRRYDCTLQEVHEIVQSLTPGSSQVSVHRDVEANIITYFYVQDLSTKIERELRRRYRESHST